MLRVQRAMAVGMTAKIWEIEELLSYLAKGFMSEPEEEWVEIEEWDWGINEEGELNKLLGFNSLVQRKG